MNHISEICSAQGITGRELAKRCGIDPTLLSKFANGHCLPTTATLTSMENALQLDRLDLFDYADLDLLQGRTTPNARSKRSDNHKPCVKKTYRISPVFAASIPVDVLEVCGYSDWTAWHYAALKKLLGEYAARKKHMKKGAV